MFRRITLMTLALAVAVSVTAMTAFCIPAGAAFTDQANIRHTQAVEDCVEKGLLTGYPDGSFGPQKNLTRAQLCTVVLRLLGLEGTAPAGECPFADVPSSFWAKDTITLCYERGIVAGMGSGKFAPGSPVTGTQAAKILLTALGDDAKARGYVGSGWADAVNTRAQSLGLYALLGSDFKADAVLTRDNTAQMLSTAAGLMGGKAQLLLAEAAYPAAPAYPAENPWDSLDKNLTDAEWEALNDQYAQQWEDWNRNKIERMSLSETADDGLAGFFRASAPVFLQSEKENAVYSPFNVYAALAMLTECTGGDTRADLLGLLGEKDIETLRDDFGALWLANYSPDGPLTSLLANSMWLREGYPFTQSTLDTLAKRYYASSYSGTMGSPELNQALQSWLKENTGGLLDEQAGNMELDPETVLALASAVYFRADWDSTFMKELTKADTFTTPSGDVQTDFMHSTSRIQYYWGDKFGAICLNFSDGGGMWLLLPEKGTAPSALFSGDAMDCVLDPANWAHSGRRTVILSMPKFDITADRSLAEGLAQLGVGGIFSPQTADFSALSEQADGLYVSRVEHAARVQVDEEGCAAAAFTVITACGTAFEEPPEEIDFDLDRPFAFVITSPAGQPMFAGVVNNPNG